jgi:hypothetical protein
VNAGRILVQVLVLPLHVGGLLDGTTMVRKCFSPELAQSAGLAVNRFPETKDEIAKAEEALAKELEKLTLDEQEKIIFDVHGLPRYSLEDDPDELEARLQALEVELDNITKDRETYDEVRARNPAYVESRRFRLLFLRAESYDAKAAAEMIMSHFDVKKKLFGEGEILWRDVHQSDLQPMAITLLEEGSMQMFPSRDAAGRTIVAMSPEFRKHGTKASLFLPLVRLGCMLPQQEREIPLTITLDSFVPIRTKLFGTLQWR